MWVGDIVIMACSIVNMVKWFEDVRQDGMSTLFCCACDCSIFFKDRDPKQEYMVIYELESFKRNVSRIPLVLLPRLPEAKCKRTPTWLGIPRGLDFSATAREAKLWSLR